MTKETKLKTNEMRFAKNDTIPLDNNPKECQL